MSAVTKQEIVEVLRELSSEAGYVIPPLADRIERHGIALPDGWVLVPKEPTMEMVAALGFGGELHLAIGHANLSMSVCDDYKAMLSAAPEVKP